MNIQGKVAIVTGGSGGLGEATARALVEAGAKVAIWDLKEDMGRAVVESLGSDNAYYSNINVTDEAAVEAFLTNRISFAQIAPVVLEAMGKLPTGSVETMEEILDLVARTKAVTEQIIINMQNR